MSRLVGHILVGRTNCSIWALACAAKRKFQSLVARSTIDTELKASGVWRDNVDRDKPAEDTGSIPLPEGASTFDERCETKRKRKGLRRCG